MKSLWAISTSEFPLKAKSATSYASWWTSAMLWACSKDQPTMMWRLMHRGSATHGKFNPDLTIMLCINHKVQPAITVLLLTLKAQKPALNPRVTLAVKQHNPFILLCLTECPILHNYCIHFTLTVEVEITELPYNTSLTMQYYCSV